MIGQEDQDETKGNKAARLIPKLLTASVLLGIIIYVVVDGARISQGLADFLEWLRIAGWIGILAFTGVYIVATVCFVPGSLLTLGAGFAFTRAFGLGVGIAVATAAVFVGASIGACIAFLLARFVLRDWARRQARKFQVLIAIDSAIKGKGRKIIFLLRLSPLIPFNVFNYVMGTTAAKFKDYAVACLGMLPGTIGFVYIGSALGDISQASSGDTGNSVVKYILLGVGILATIGAVVLITMTSKRELAKYIDQKPSSDDSTATVSSTHNDNP